MYVAIKSIGFAPNIASETKQRLRAALAETTALPFVTGAAVMDTLPHALNGGEFMWRATFADERSYHELLASAEWNETIAPLLDPAAGVLVEGASYSPTWSETTRPSLTNGVWRLLLLACEEGATLDQREAMERDHLLMPRYVPEIRNWAFGRVQHATGRRRWSYVWEQEFDDLGGLNGPYMNHPIHWGLVDAWYDVECPQRIVDPHTIHAVGEISQSIMAPDERRSRAR